MSPINFYRIAIISVRPIRPFIRFFPAELQSLHGRIIITTPPGNDYNSAGKKVRVRMVVLLQFWYMVRFLHEFCGVANPVVAAKFLFAAKIMFLPCNNN